MKNNKGFLLAETIVTVCIIATLATSMYIYVSKTANRFEDRNNYEKVVDVYKLNTIKNYLGDKLKPDYVSNIDKNNDITNLKDELHIKCLYFVKDDSYNNKYNIENIPTSLKDYLNWIKIDESSNNYRLIAMFQDDKNPPTFANMIISTQE